MSAGANGCGHANCSTHTDVYEYAFAHGDSCAVAHFNFHRDPGAIANSYTTRLADIHSQANSSPNTNSASRHEGSPHRGCAADAGTNGRRVWWGVQCPGRASEVGRGAGDADTAGVPGGAFLVDEAA